MIFSVCLNLMCYHCTLLKTSMHLNLVYQTLNILFSVVKKLCRKDPQLFSHRGSFDHLDLQSLNDYNFYFLFFHFATVLLERVGTYNIPLERYCQELSNGMLQALGF